MPVGVIMHTGDVLRLIGRVRSSVRIDLVDQWVAGRNPAST